MLSRRDLLHSLTAAAAVRLLPAAVPGAPLFFTQNEFALLDALTEMIVPADSHSPGAHAAGVAAYIDRVTAEAFEPSEKQNWRKGLASVEAESNKRHGSSFLKLSAADQVALLSAMDRGNDPFFGQLKQTTAFAYYSSKVGIHEEMNYLGNVVIQEFVGYLPVKC